MIEMIEFGIADAGDTPHLCRLLEILFAQEAEFDADPLRQQTAITMLLAQQERATILVARYQGNVVGMVSLLYSISTVLGGPVAILEDMIVDPVCRGQQIGSRLLRFAIDTARQRGCLRITLLTDSDNLAAQQFYRSQGFMASSMLTMRLML